MAKIERALISVSDKSGLVEFARGLAELGVEILSTGGTARLLNEQGVAVRDVADYTGFPEMMDGRVKTLHPKVHGGILALRDNAEHVQQASDHGIQFIDLVVVNLYPFRETVARPDVTYAEAIENIDIGGPTMVRSAAKNHAHVGVLTSPEQYDEALDELRECGELADETRRDLARAAFEHTALYDSAITRYLSVQEDDSPDEAFAPFESFHLRRRQTLRYGENPHQSAAFFDVVGTTGPWTQMTQLGGKELSYNNILDADAAWCAASVFEEPTCAVIKHTNPCGLASHEDIVEAYRRAFAADPISAFGGIIAVNRPIDEALAGAIRDSRHPTSGARLFVEIVMAQEYTPEGLDLLRKSANLRILELPVVADAAPRLRAVEGNVLLQMGDAVEASDIAWEVVTKREPTDQEWADIRFAWRCVKHVKSNAIVIAKDRTLLGMGAGQPNRVNSVRLSLEQAGLEAAGAALASDAMFPFNDAVSIGVAHGVRAFVQPGGSMRDEDSVSIVDAAGGTMVLTGIRHFRH